MSDVLAVKPQNRFLAWGTAAGVVLLALGGFILSFSALTDLAVHSGIVPGLAFIWPLIVDGFIVVATAAAFALKRRGRQVTWYPWTALILFSAVSVAGNASHAVNAENVTVPVWVATVVSSVPAIALLIASHLLVVMIDGKTRPTPARKSAKPKALPAVEVEATNVPPAAGKPREAKGPDRASPVATRPSLRAVDFDPAMSPEYSKSMPAEPESLVAQLERIVADGGQVTGALIASLEGVSERTGRRRLERLRDDHPHLFASEYEPAEAAR